MPGAVLLLVAAFAAPSAGLLSAPAPVRAPAERQLQVERLQSLSFGVFVAPGEGSVTVPPSGLDVAYEHVFPMRGSPSGAVFQIKGKPRQAVEVQLPGQIETRSGAAHAVLHAFKAEAEYRTGFEAVGPNAYRVELDASGRNLLHVGGRLDLRGGTPQSGVNADLWLSARALDDGAAR